MRRDDGAEEGVVAAAAAVGTGGIVPAGSFDEMPLEGLKGGGGGELGKNCMAVVVVSYRDKLESVP